MCRNTSNCTLPPLYCENDKFVHWDCSLGAKGGSTSACTVGWWINCLVGAWTWFTVLELPNLGRYFRVICYYGSIRAYETGFNYYYGQAPIVESRVRGEGKGKKEKAKGATGAPWPNVHVNWAEVFAYHSILLTELQIAFGTNISHKKAPTKMKEGITELAKSFDWLTDVGCAPHHSQHKCGNSNKSTRSISFAQSHSVIPSTPPNKYYQPTTCHRMLAWQSSQPTNQHVTQPGHV